MSWALQNHDVGLKILRFFLNDKFGFLLIFLLSYDPLVCSWITFTNFYIQQWELETFFKNENEDSHNIILSLGPGVFCHTKYPKTCNEMARVVNTVFSWFCPGNKIVDFLMVFDCSASGSNKNQVCVCSSLGLEGRFRFVVMLSNWLTHLSTPCPDTIHL